MSVKVVGGIGVSSRGGGIYMDMAAYGRKASGSMEKPIAQTVPDEKTISTLPWSFWGTDNQLPAQYIKDIESCGVLNSIIDGKARFALCQGMVPAIVHTDPSTGQRVIDKIVDDSEITDFLEMNNHFDHVYGWMRDQVGFSWMVARFMLNKGMDKIVAFQRDDLTETRFSKKNTKTGLSSHLYYSANWDKVRSPNDERVFKIPLLNPNNPVLDLQEKAAAGIAQHAMALRNPGWGKHYYPIPAWMANILWVQIAQGVPEMKQALFENSMRPKYKVIIMEEYWDNRYGTDWNEWDEDEQEKKRQALYDEIDEWLVGAKNAHKSIFVNGNRDGDGKVYTDIDIIPIEDNTKPGELLPDSAAANSEIAIGMLWNPAMTGGNQKAGQYQGNEGGSNVRENTLFQTILHEVERQKVSKIMNVIKFFNGWHKKHKGLEFIIPATVLTTTDTGGSSKPVVTGGVNPKEKQKDGADKNDSGSEKRAA